MLEILLFFIFLCIILLIYSANLNDQCFSLKKNNKIIEDNLEILAKFNDQLNNENRKLQNKISKQEKINCELQQKCSDMIKKGITF